jgi:uncharacterized protein
MEISVAKLLRGDAGTLQKLEVSIPQLELDGTSATDIRVTGQLVAFEEEVHLTGTVRSTVAVACSRCLVEFPYAADAELKERFSETPDEEAWPIEQERIDLEPAVSAALILAIPPQPLHEPTCRGLCPVCGKNLNLEPHQHEETVEDHPFAELEKLKDRTEE